VKRRVARETNHDITRKLIQIGIRQAGEASRFDAPRSWLPIHLMLSFAAGK
jgi:hypothetical protein